MASSTVEHMLAVGAIQVKSIQADSNNHCGHALAQANRLQQYKANPAYHFLDQTVVGVSSSLCMCFKLGQVWSLTHTFKLFCQLALLLGNLQRCLQIRAKAICKQPVRA